MRSLLALCALFAAFVAPSAAAAEFKGVAYTAPAGWATEEQGGALLLAPPGVDESNALIVVLFAVAPLGSAPFRAWFDQRMAENLHAKASVLNQGDVRSISDWTLARLTTARAVRDAEGAVRFQLFSGVSDGRVAGLAMAVVTNEQIGDRYADTLRGFFESLRVGARTAVAPPAAQATPPAAQTAPPSGLPAGQYHCITSRYSPTNPTGPILYEASVLGRLILDGRGGYQVSASGNSGNYRLSGGSFAFTSGPLAGWPALVETVDNRPRIRLSRDKNTAPNPSGASFGDHRCTWRG